MNDDVWALGAAFFFTAIFAVGGASALIPEFHRQIVDLHGWMTSESFSHSVALAQLAPGPNMLLVSLIGWQLGGVPGLLVATFAILVPPSILAFAVGRAMAGFNEAPWLTAVKRSLGPIVVGLTTVSGYVTARGADRDVIGIAITVCATAFIVRVKRNPLWVIGGGAIIGILAHRAGLMNIG